MHYPAFAFLLWLCLSDHVKLKAVRHYESCAVDLVIEALVLSCTDTPFTNTLCTNQGPRIQTSLDWSSTLRSVQHYSWLNIVSPLSAPLHQLLVLILYSQLCASEVQKGAD